MFKMKRKKYLLFDRMNLVIIKLKIYELLLGIVYNI